MASGVQLMLKLMNMSDEGLGMRYEELGIRDEDELLSEGEKLGIITGEYRAFISSSVI